MRRAGALGLRTSDPKDIADAYGTIGDGFCVDERPELRNNGSFDLTQNPVQSWRLANLIVDIYCPWLSRFPKPTPSSS
jgi:hypothetical protein